MIELLRRMTTVQDVIDFLRTGLVPSSYTEDGWAVCKMHKACTMLCEIADRDRWIPVEEKLPEEESEYLVADKWGYVFEANYEKALSGFVYVNPSGDRLADKTVTHWREMPAPPEAK